MRRLIAREPSVQFRSIDFRTRRESLIVYVGVKQWRGVAAAMKDPEDVLIIEGTLTWDAEQQAIAVFTTKIASKLKQRATRASPSAEVPTEPTPPVESTPT
ncbi:MAG: hypothetical protein WCK70_11625 [Chloroflexales bacterium]